METITGESENIFGRACLSKSPNKQNRLFLTAEPVEKAFHKALCKGKIGPNCTLEQKEQNAVFREYGWDKNRVSRIWDYGISDDGGSGSSSGGFNIIVDDTKGVQYLQDIKDSVTAAFQDVCHEGILCNEEIKGCLFSIQDVKLHADAIHRGQGQIIPPARRCMYACMIKSEPRLLEPFFLAEINCPTNGGHKAKVYKCLNGKRGEFISEDTPPNDDSDDESGSEAKDEKTDDDRGQLQGQAVMYFFLPVAESFGFTKALRQATGGKANPSCSFHHWEKFGGDPYEEGSKAQKLVLEIRERKGLKVEMPKFEKYNDKL